MITKEFEITAHDEKYNVYSESYSSMAECISAITKRPYLYNENYSSQYIQRGSIGDQSPDWLGFGSIDEFIDICKNGIQNTDAVKNVMRYAMKAATEDKDKLVKKTMDVAGGAVDVPLFLSGSPECMMGLKRARVKSRVIKAAINCEVLCSVSVEEYIRAGTAISKAVASLEKAGYRVRLIANAGFMSNADHHNLGMLSVVVKRENEPCNFRRMLMPMLSTAFWRGTAFNWASTCPNFNPGYGLGKRMDCAFGWEEENEKMDEIVRKVNGELCCRFSINDVLRMVRNNGDDHTEAYLRAKMMSLE